MNVDKILVSKARYFYLKTIQTIYNLKLQTIRKFIKNKEIFEINEWCIKINKTKVEIEKSEGYLVYVKDQDNLKELLYFAFLINQVKPIIKIITEYIYTNFKFIYTDSCKSFNSVKNLVLSNKK